MKKQDLDKINSLIRGIGIEIVNDDNNFRLKKRKVYNKFFSDPVDGKWYKILAGKNGYSTGGCYNNGYDQITHMSVDIEDALKFAKEYQSELNESLTNEKEWLQKHKQVLCDHINTKDFYKSGTVPTKGEICVDCGLHINVINL